jgi:hypothetical protein
VDALGSDQPRDDARPARRYRLVVSARDRLELELEAAPQVRVIVALPPEARHDLVDRACVGVAAGAQLLLEAFQVGIAERADEPDDRHFADAGRGGDGRAGLVGDDRAVVAQIGGDGALRRRHAVAAPVERRPEPVPAGGRRSVLRGRHAPALRASPAGSFDAMMASRSGAAAISSAV